MSSEAPKKRGRPPSKMPKELKLLTNEFCGLCETRAADGKDDVLPIQLLRSLIASMKYADANVTVSMPLLKLSSPPTQPTDTISFAEDEPNYFI